MFDGNRRHTKGLSFGGRISTGVLKKNILIIRLLNAYNRLLSFIIA